ncbi:MAG: DUF2029 domain-containing protein [Candidatus Sumerlaeaceae bacterium]|nr:DUF2029 domain-containing protein [Candidatus Sumerlaeaceae bacterium]
METIRRALSKLCRMTETHPFRAVLALWLVLAIVITVGDAVTGKVRRDFASYSLAAAKTMFQGGNPYSRDEAQTSYKYFPLNATLLWPFTKMPLPLAQGIWTATNATLLGICLWVHRRVWARELRVPWWVWAIALAVGLRFFVKNLRLGQWNTSVYCLSFLGLSAIVFGKERLGAFLSSLAAGLKYLPGFFALYLVLRGRWRAAALMVAGFCFWVLVFPTLVHGPGRHWELLQNYWGRASKQYQGMVSGDYTSSLSLRSTVMRMTSEVKPRFPDPDTYDFTIVVLPRETARQLSEFVAYVTLASAMFTTLLVSRRLAAAQNFEPPSDNPRSSGIFQNLTELLLVGLWYTTLLMISPESRMPHFLSLFTPAFALSVALANSAIVGKAKYVVSVLLGVATLSLLLGSEIWEHLRYHLVLKGLGCYAWAQLALWAACILAVLQLTKSGQERSS